MVHAKKEEKYFLRADCFCGSRGDIVTIDESGESSTWFNLTNGTHGSPFAEYSFLGAYTKENAVYYWNSKHSNNDIYLSIDEHNRIGVNWAGKGLLSREDAMIFGERLLDAVRKAKQLDIEFEND